MKHYLALVVFLFSTTVFSTPLEKLPQGVKYKIVSIDSSLIQSRFSGSVIGYDEFQELVDIDIRRQLDASGLLVPDDEESAVGLDIFLDYSRRFVGDASPVATTTVRAPDFYYTIKFIDKGEVIYHIKSKKLTLRSNGYFNLGKGFGKHYLTDLKYVFSATKTVANKIKELSPSAENKSVSVYIDKNDKSLAPAFTAWSKERKKQEGEVLDYTFYIPDTVSEQYISSLKSASSPKEREKIYKQLYKAWLNLSTLNDFIVSEVEQRYASELTKQEQTELAWAVKAVASSGMKQYIPFLEKMAQNEKHPTIKKHAAAMLKQFANFRYRANAIHDSDHLPLDYSWQKKQVITQLQNNYIDMRMEAIKTIRSDFKKDKDVLDVLRSILIDEAHQDNYMTESNVGFYNWACRLLGESGNRHYLSTLNKVKKEASSKSVRKYAKKFIRVLESS